MKELNTIQVKLKAPKDKKNTFGGYSYRSCEGILEAVKPLLKETSCTLTLKDEIVEVGGRIYVKATATITNDIGESVETVAFAREEENKKGMDASQLTGATSSYARKYALNGLFAIDDNKDADTDEYAASDSTSAPKPSKGKKEQPKVQVQTAEDSQFDVALLEVRESNTIQELNAAYLRWPKYKDDKRFLDACHDRKVQIQSQAQ